MKNLTILLYFFILFILLISCTNKKNNYQLNNDIIIDHIDKSKIERKDLKGENIIVDSYYIDMNGAMMEYSRKNNILVFRNAEYNKDKPYFLIYSIDKNKIIKEAGKKGEGPTDFLKPDFIINDKLEDKIGYLLDFGNYKLYDIDNQFNFIFKKKLGINDDTNILGLFLLDDSLAVSISHNSKKGLLINILNNGKIRQIYDLSILPSVNFFYAYNGTLQINHKMKRMMYAYKFFNEIHFFDFEGKALKILRGKDKNRNKSDGIDEWLDNPYTPMYYMSSYSTDKYVYLQYAEERTLSEPFKEYTIIDQYDWDGNFIMEYKLDKPHGIICADDEKRLFYFLTTTEDDPLYLYKY
ncbi:MAG: TolB-like 6-bladed beta-propeller domain-containing protein [Tannerellaceae bacterium]|jgi:hypothetical protein|nr:TolB-like 6-bladed beta-propeller domain-containing protein [Tannerellaceae bacterium]